MIQTLTWFCHILQAPKETTRGNMGHDWRSGLTHPGPSQPDFENTTYRLNSLTDDLLYQVAKQAIALSRATEGMAKERHSRCHYRSLGNFARPRKLRF